MKKGLKTLFIVSAISLMGIGGLSSCGPSTGENNSGDTQNKEYLVTLGEHENLELSLDKTKAKKDELITLTIVLPEEKDLDKILVNGTEVSFDVVEARKKYSFKMTEGDALVTVTLKDRVYENHELIVNEVADFKVEFYLNEAKVTSAKKGDEILVKVTSTSTTKRFLSLTSNEVTLTRINDTLDFTFVMVNETVTLELKCEDIPSRNLTLELPKGVTGAFKQNDLEVTKALEGTTVYLALEVDTENYTFKTLNWTGIDANLVVTEEVGKLYSFTVGLNDIKVAPVVELIPSYTLKATVNEGASVKFTKLGQEVNTAKEGEEITLTVTLTPKYVVKTITTNLENFTLPELKDNALTFKMPKGNLEILVETEYIPEKYEITSLKTYGLNTDYVIGLKEKDMILEGTKVKGSLKYSYESDVYTLLLNGKKIPLTYDPNAEIEGVSRKGAMVFEFEMPAENVDIIIYEDNTATQDEATGFTVNYNVNNELYDVYGLQNGAKYAHKSITYFFVVPKKGVLVNKVSVTYDENTSSTQLRESSYEPCQFSVSTGTSYVTNKITLTIEAEKTGTFDIGFTNQDEFTVKGELKEVTVGQKVRLELVVNEGYKFENTQYAFIKEATCDNLDVTFSKSNITVSTGSSYSLPYIEFIMPSGNVSITIATLKAIPINVALIDEITECKITTDEAGTTKVTSCFPGDNLYIRPTAIAGKKIHKAIVNGQEIALYKDEYFRYSVRNSDQTIEISFEATTLRTVNYVEDTAKYEIKGIKTNYIAGDTVTFTVKPLMGFSIEKVSLDDPTIELTQSTYDKTSYSFTMPDKDVAIAIETKENPVGTLSFTARPSWYTGYSDLSFTNVDAYDLVYNGNKVEVGTKLKFKAPSSYYIMDGYAFKGIKHNGVEVTGSGYYGDEFIFTVVEGENKIEFICEKLPTHQLTLDLKVSDALSVKGIYSDDTYISNTSGADLTESKRARVEFNVLDQDGKYALDNTSFTLTDANGAPVEFTFKKTTLVLTIEFTQPTSAVTLTFNPKVQTGKAVTIDTKSLAAGDHGNVTVNGVAITTGTRVEANAEVVIKITIYEYYDYDYGYNEDNLYSYNYFVTVTNAAGEEIVPETAYTSRSQEVKFTMPDSEVTITLKALRK